MALVYGELGDFEMAFSFPDRGHNRRDISLTSLKIDPKFDRLRSDPRFDLLIKKIGYLA